ncbi:MAG: hypothetical protein Q9217_004368 [Psora testacea]
MVIGQNWVIENPGQTAPQILFIICFALQKNFRKMSDCFGSKDSPSSSHHTWHPFDVLNLRSKGAFTCVFERCWVPISAEAHQQAHQILVSMQHLNPAGDILQSLFLLAKSLLCIDHQKSAINQQVSKWQRTIHGLVSKEINSQPPPERAIVTTRLPLGINMPLHPSLRRAFVVKLPPAKGTSNVAGEQTNAPSRNLCYRPVCSLPALGWKSTRQDSEIFCSGSNTQAEQRAPDTATNSTRLRTIVETRQHGECNDGAHEILKLSQDLERCKQELQDAGYQNVQDDIKYMQAIEELGESLSKQKLLHVEQAGQIKDLQDQIEEKDAAFREQADTLKELDASLKRHVRESTVEVLQLECLNRSLRTRNTLLLLRNRLGWMVEERRYREIAAEAEAVLTRYRMGDAMLVAQLVVMLPPCKPLPPSKNPSTFGGSFIHNISTDFANEGQLDTINTTGQGRMYAS